ncbi:hypothetical protein BDV98DRAFT_515895, partial [Pterulicium gracile]
MSHWKNRPQLVQRGLRRDLAPLGAKALGREQLGRRSGILACPERRAEDGSIGSSKVGRPHSERSGPLVHYHPVPNPFDYENKYPEDAYGEEFGDNARVWKVYMDEAELFDVELTEGWKDTVDVLLVFAGLFSAVVATLAGISIQALQPDYAQVTVDILLELLAVQRAIASGNTAADVTPASFSLNAFPSASTLDRWVNGLWFTSLAFSLCTALIATIIKQWIQQYRAFAGGTTLEQVIHRQYRFMGLNKWRVPTIIALLPSLLHVSLFLFLAGMSLFLYPL